MDYSSVPSIFGFIPTVEFHIDLDYQEDRVTFKKLCVVRLYASLLQCDRISRASGVPSGSMQADTTPDAEQCKRKLNNTHEPRLVRLNIACCGFGRLNTVINCSLGYPVVYIRATEPRQSETKRRFIVIICYRYYCD